MTIRGTIAPARSPTATRTRRRPDAVPPSTPRVLRCPAKPTSPQGASSSKVATTSGLRLSTHLADGLSSTHSRHSLGLGPARAAPSPCTWRPDRLRHSPEQAPPDTALPTARRRSTVRVRSSVSVSTFRRRAARPTRSSENCWSTSMAPPPAPRSAVTSRGSRSTGSLGHSRRRMDAGSPCTWSRMDKT